MVTGLLKSKLRRDILQLYFAHPEKEYYIRELERLLNRPAAYVRRELLSLEKTGLFTSEYKGNQKYFHLNNKYPLYSEIKNIVSKTIGVEGSLREIFKQFKDVQIAFIFGSFARSEEDSLSDVDLMIIGNLNEDALLEKIIKLEGEINREINYHIYSLKEIKDKAKEKDGFIEEILTSNKRLVKGSADELPKID